MENETFYGDGLSALGFVFKHHRLSSDFGATPFDLIRGNQANTIGNVDVCLENTNMLILSRLNSIVPRKREIPRFLIRPPLVKSIKIGLFNPKVDLC